MNARESTGVSAGRPSLCIGSVSYLNAKPLIWGIEREGDVRLLLDVPSRLLAGLREGRFDVALLPVIDYQRMPGLRIVPAGGIGCDGPTLTVRIFSRVPIERIGRLACDTDSHTSVALARVVLAERWGARPVFVDLSLAETSSHHPTVPSSHRWGDGEMGRSRCLASHRRQSRLRGAGRV
jgi:chorismate dehydratase